MTDTSTILIVVGIFIIAGTIKGVIGLGLPTVSLALLTVTIDLPSAMALLLIPSFITNLWQAFIGGNLKLVFARIRPFLLAAVATVWIGATALTRVNLSLLSALLGGLLVAYSTINLAGLNFMVRPRDEKWVGVATGLVNGVLTGMTGSFVVPGVMYLQAINLTRDALIQAMGLLFMLSTLALAFSLQQTRLLTVEQGTLSLIALLPAIAGMGLGQKIRKSLSEALFRKVFFVSILILGIYIMIHQLGAYI